MKILRRSLKTLDKLDKVEAYKKAKTKYIITEETIIESEPIPLDSDLTTAIESFNPLDPF